MQFLWALRLILSQKNEVKELDIFKFDWYNEDDVYH